MLLIAIQRSRLNPVIGYSQKYMKMKVIAAAETASAALIARCRFLRMSGETKKYRKAVMARMAIMREFIGSVGFCIRLYREDFSVAMCDAILIARGMVSHIRVAGTRDSKGLGQDAVLAEIRVLLPDVKTVHRRKTRGFRPSHPRVFPDFGIQKSVRDHSRPAIRRSQFSDEEFQIPDPAGTRSGRHSRGIPAHGLQKNQCSVLRLA